MTSPWALQTEVRRFVFPDMSQRRAMDDRRPASNVDPYKVTDIIVETTLVDR
ncbi:hypothetical protein BGY98DRAFT_1093402 [Russula aff. rugulosa BPL654]|nr:hypothetical protein BGY98DRAFT_1093402 [Russula aff. rugulosa BPL654]